MLSGFFFFFFGIPEHTALFLFHGTPLASLPQSASSFAIFLFYCLRRVHLCSFASLSAIPSLNLPMILMRKALIAPHLPGYLPSSSCALRLLFFLVHITSFFSFSFAGFSLCYVFFFFVFGLGLKGYSLVLQNIIMHFLLLVFLNCLLTVLESPCSSPRVEFNEEKL